ncbi:MAG: hypothetical protein HY775_07225 [Acidobacteria bacterium]|nr:hypothetical protein [Acidobacteriota bacterium]
MTSERTLERRREQLAGRLPEVGELIRGSVVERRMRCGKPSCRCQTDPDAAHGPYLLLMTTVGRGKTRTMVIPRDEARWVRGAVRRYRQLEELLESISETNWQLLKARADRGRVGR